MPPKPPLPPAATRLWCKRGTNDCAIASLASFLGRDYEEVLVWAARVNPQMWAEGLTAGNHVTICKRLGVPARWVRRFDVNEERGVLWVSYHDDMTRHHSMLLEDGRVYDADHDPIVSWEIDDYLRVRAAYPFKLLKKVME